MRLLMTTIAAAATLLTGTAASAVTLINGSFEDGVASIDPFLTVATGDATSITGWTVLSDGVDYIGSYWQASNGVRSLDLSAITSGGVMQTVTGFVTGKRYRITFDVSANPTGDATRPKRILVSATGGEAVSYDYSNPDNTLADMQYETFTYDFIATDTFQDVQFRSLEFNPYGTVLDNVSISLVPEPATWALLVAGFAMTGALVRRRARVRSALA